MGFVLAWAWAACSPVAAPMDGGGGPDVITINCIPGGTHACICPDAVTSGVQTCNAQGSAYGACGPCATSGPDGGTPTGCAGRACGADGMGGYCGSCPGGLVCSAAGQCVTPPPACGGRVCGPDGVGGTCGACPTGQTCNASGRCETAGPGPCSAANPTGSCPSGQTCVSGTCCAQPCAGSCCAEGSLCIADASGNQSCARRCTGSSECSGAQNCCAPLYDTTTHAPLAYGACLQFGVGGVSACRCATGTECASRVCAPQLDATQNPVGPSICVADDCGPYRGCSGLRACGNGYCNLCDARGNCYCARACSNDTMCGAARCATWARSNGSCPNTQTACAPR